uniref:Uncharacterized protein n=1 Tax=Timema cristinae TaxID=61476 RepID=A0A7R9CB99_TIMCR|nr:unnamed protein product [Timema cristinae]
MQKNILYARKGNGNFDNSDTVKSSVLQPDNFNNSDNANSVSTDTFSIANKDVVPSENIPNFTLAFLDDKKKTNIGKVGDNPLHLCVKEGNEVKVKRQCLVLSALKNNIDTKNFFEETALHIAVKEDFSKIVDLLLKFGSNPNIQDADGNNALHLAILNLSFDCLKEIISGTRTNWLEKSVNQFNFEGFAPIHLAVKMGHIETITALLGAGADINLKGRKNFFYIIFIVYLFIVFSQDVKSGRNPLFHAVEMDHTEMVSTLVKAGADSLEPNFAGQSAFQAAKEVHSKNKQMISHMITTEGMSNLQASCGSIHDYLLAADLLMN